MQIIQKMNKEQMTIAELPAPILANTLLAAVFLVELAELMKKHNASICLEHIWRDEYNSDTELWFKVNDVYLNEHFTTTGQRDIKAVELFESLSNGS